MIPSSDQIASDSRPSSSRIRALSASPQAAWTRPPNGRQHAQPPVADLVAEALDHDRPVGRDDARRLPAARAGTRPGCWRRARRGRSRARALRRLVDRPARERADRLAELLRAPDRRRPSRTGPRPAGPGAGVTITRSRPISSIRQVVAPSRNVWPGPRLVDHLLVELADAAAVGERDGVQAAVGDRAGVGDRELARARAGRGSCPRRGPRRSAGAARRTRSRGSGRRACRARSRAACAAELGVGVGARDERVQLVDGDRLARRAPRPRSRRSAGRARRAGCAARPSSRSRPRACAWRRPRTRAGRRGTWGRSGRG